MAKGDANTHINALNEEEKKKTIKQRGGFEHLDSVHAHTNIRTLGF